MADACHNRARLRNAESFIRERSAAAEANWSTISSNSSNSNNSSSMSRHNNVVGKILGVLEELDRFVFDKNDPNSNCLDALASRIWGPISTPGQGLTAEVAAGSGFALDPYLPIQQFSGSGSGSWF